MIKFENAVRAAMGVVMVLILAPSSAAEPAKKPTRPQVVAARSTAAPTTKQATAQKQAVAEYASIGLRAFGEVEGALRNKPGGKTGGERHHQPEVVVQVEVEVVGDGLRDVPGSSGDSG